MTERADPRPSYPTSLGVSAPTTIRLLGHDLTEELMGQVGFGELAFWLLARRRPSPGEVRVFESVLVALADHGFTPTAIAARVTYLSAPDALQGALAAGLLGGGSRFLGVTEDCARFLADELATLSEQPVDEAGWDAAAARAVETARDEGRLVPGLGHPVHKDVDPRTPALIRIATDEGTRGPHLRLFEAIGRVHPRVLGRTLPLNGAGVCGATLADLGLPVDLLRGVALLARCAGLLGQLAEERAHPMAMDLYRDVEQHAVEVPIDRGSGPPLLRTERLVLREWSAGDADFVLDAYSRWEVMRYLGDRPRVMTEPAEAVAAIDRWRAASGPVLGLWAVTLAETGEILGNVLLKDTPASGDVEPLQPSGDIEIGWHLHPDAWGHGYATEAAAAVLEHARAHGIDRVIAVTYPDNVASQRVCTRIGLEHAGRTDRYYNTEFDLFETPNRPQ